LYFAYTIQLAWASTKGIGHLPADVMSGSADGMTNHTDPDVLKLLEQVGINRIELFETFGLIDRIFKAGLWFINVFQF
jgi:hypothetical protein